MNVRGMIPGSWFSMERDPTADVITGQWWIPEVSPPDTLQPKVHLLPAAHVIFLPFSLPDLFLPWESTEQLCPSVVALDPALPLLCPNGISVTRETSLSLPGITDCHPPEFPKMEISPTSSFPTAVLKL